jgi:release factor glutamine methyltransferase
VAATDLSADALALARQNVEKTGFDERIRLYQGDLLDALPDGSEPVDLIVSNPPYVPEESRDDVMIDVREFEPDDALFAGPDGLSVLERLVDQAADGLVDGGWLAVEIGHQQGEAVADLFEKAGFREVDVRRDYGDRDRVVSGHT